ncbi:PaaI family thioesterase [Blastococcus sp. Marseille-P5729]|uniref:PaaI family thioesterase n=1 Tax=Blastococcus sp. Marseille-P5729 TaxID=2086582 RepID=UPI000D0EE3FA|nr:PaaI family thioesterase [Blastococcus sp. Marseille-P5729]
MGYRELTGYTVEVVGPGEAVARMTVTDDHLNRGGVMHGGAIATMCDSAMGHAVVSGAGPGKTSATASMNMVYFASAVPGDHLTVRAKVIKAGRTTVFAEADVTRDGDGRALAQGVATFVVRDRRS